MSANPLLNRFVLLLLAGSLGCAACQPTAEMVMPEHPVFEWEVHDENRPRPAAVTPPTPSTQDQPGRPPSDAVVLFDGHSLDAWQTQSGGPAPWRVEDGYMEVRARTGSIWTKRAFGDIQLHLEWQAPTPPRGDGQGRGNSGIKLMGRYEVQILDSYENETYADGQAASVYSQYPPLVNAARPPGQWQVYDIIFRRPRFDAEGRLLRPAYLTVLHNGVLVQDHTELTGPTGRRRPAYQAHEDRLPIMLQDHGDPVRFRNIWVRELPEDG